MNSGSISPAAWAERYESLRRHVLEGRQRLGARPLGLALWVAKGMAGWMGQWTQLADPERRLPRLWPAPSTTSPVGWQQTLTVLLAQITLEHLQPRVSL